MTRWTYRADHRKRPHVHPLATPSGAVLTRDAPDGAASGWTFGRFRWSAL